MHSVERRDLSGLRNSGLIKFFSRVEEIIKKAYGTETCGFAVSFLESSQQYELAYLGCDQASGEALLLADSAADAAWSALSCQLHASLHHPKEEKRAAAVLIDAKFSEFTDPTRLNFEEEYEQIGKALEMLRSFPEQTLELSYLSEYVDSLSACYDKFMALYLSVRDKKRNTELCRLARAKTLERYDKFCEILDVQSRISSEPRVIEVIEGINKLRK